MKKFLYYTRLTAILICFSTTAHALEEVKKQLVCGKSSISDRGNTTNIEDNNPAIFKFPKVKTDVQMTERNGTAISLPEIPIRYNTKYGMWIYDNGMDVCSLEYANKSPYPLHKVMTLGAIRMYQLLIAPSKGTKCSMYPHCSLYGQIAFSEYNPIQAFAMTADRLFRCGRDISEYGQSQCQTLKTGAESVSDLEN